MNEVFQITVLAIILIISLTALCAALSALFPNRLTFMRAIIHTSTRRAFIVGALILLFFGAITLGFVTLAQRLEGNPVSIVFWLVGGAIALTICTALGFGITVLSQRVGEYFTPDATPLRTIITGALVLLVGCSTPVLGWFILLPFVLSTGTGAFVSSLPSSVGDANK